MGLEIWAPSAASDGRFRQWWADFLRLAGSPGPARSVVLMSKELDVRHVLPTIQVPTLILHRTGDRNVNIGQARYMAEHIPGAKLVELPGEDNVWYVGDTDALTDEIQQFLTGVRLGTEPDHVLATLMFTDIVGSTELAARLGDRGWRDLLQRYQALVRRQLMNWRGREIDTAGDGFLAGFDGPARSIRCACRIRDGLRPLGMHVRTGLHTGECELMGEKLAGIAVHIGARVAAQAMPGEVLVSHTVRDLVVGSGIRFEARGVHPLKGVPGEWPLFAVASDGERSYRARRRVQAYAPSQHCLRRARKPLAGSRLPRGDRRPRAAGRGPEAPSRSPAATR
jgi:class 3 adenylate cyclase